MPEDKPIQVPSPIQPQAKAPLAVRALQAYMTIRGINPNEWFSGGAPPPSTIPQSVKSRRYDFKPNINISYTPKDEGLQIWQLRALAKFCPLAECAIITVVKQMQSLPWSVQKSGAKKNDPQDAKAKELEARLKYPDNEHDFSTFLGILVEEQLVHDNPTIYNRLNVGGESWGWEIMDAATIKRLISSDGRTPFPPEASYMQVLKGQPIYYTLNEMLSYSRFPSAWRMYGYAETEQIAADLVIAIQREHWKLTYYTDGNMADVMIPVPPELGTEALENYLDHYDSQVGGNSAERHKVHPYYAVAGAGPIFAKEAILKDSFDDLIIRKICFAYDISPQQLIAQMNKSTPEQSIMEAKEEGLYTRANFWGQFFTIAMKRFWHADGYELRFEMDPTKDPLKEAQADSQMLKSGLRTHNQLLERDGKPGIDGGDVAFMETAAGLILVKDLPGIKPPAEPQAEYPAGSPKEGTDPQPSNTPTSTPAIAEPATGEPITKGTETPTVSQPEPLLKKKRVSA